MSIPVSYTHLDVYKRQVKYIGVGETIDDLQKFDPDDFVNALFTADSHEEDGEEE